MNRYALVIDHESCWGCKACEVACKQEFHFPEGLKVISVVEDGPKMVDGRLDFLFRVNMCRQCEEPPCVDVCPEEAIAINDHGIVVLNSSLCTGCQSCLETCPYDAIVFDEEEDIALKCNLCHERVAKGLLPACADNVCLAHCIDFGDPKETTNKDR